MIAQCFPQRCLLEMVVRGDCGASEQVVGERTTRLLTQVAKVMVILKATLRSKSINIVELHVEVEHRSPPQSRQCMRSVNTMRPLQRKKGKTHAPDHDVKKVAANSSS